MMRTAAEEEAVIGTGSAGGTVGRVEPAAKRNLVIMGGGIVVALLIVFTVAYFGLRSSNEPVTRAASAIALGNPAAHRRDAGEALSPRMQQELAKRQTQDADLAASEGRSYIPPDNAPIEKVSAGPATTNTQVPLNAGNSAAGFAAAALVDRSAYEQERRKGLEKFLSSFEEAQGPDEVRRRFGAAGDGGRGQPGAAQRVAGAAPAVVVTTPPAAARKLVEIFSVMAARLVLPLNIPENGTGTVLAEVVSGPQSGAFISGTARVVNEGIEIRLTQARFGKEPYAVQAIGLDGATSDQILAGSVDRKLFQRYVIPIAAAAAQGYFTAKAAVGSTVVGLSVGSGSSSGTVAGVAVPPATSAQAAAAGIAAGMQVLSADASKLATTPIVVSIPAQTPIGVLFLNEVVEKGSAQ
ncbi:MAG: DotG [Ramlibacter sp.]|jgi:hypothetical protein|nr:DotG [Ramlibacter sp.]